MNASDLRRGLALAATAAPLGCGALVARALAAHHPPALAADFRQPLVVATNWGGYGTAAFALLGACIALAAALLACAVARLRARAGPGDGSAIVLAAAVGLAGAAAWPIVFSSDVYAYAAYGDLALRGFDPYLPQPEHVHDALLDAARWQWSGGFPVDVYGPAMLAISRAIVAATGNAAVAPALGAFRGAAAVAFLASVSCAYAALAEFPAERRFVATCAYALNPVVLWSVAEGHNDAFVLLIAAVAALAAARGLAPLGGLLVGLSPVLKAPGLLLAAGFALDAVAPHRRLNARATLVATLAASVVAAAIALPPLLPALRHIEGHGRYTPSSSLQGLVGMGPAFALALAAGAYGLVQLLRGDRRGHAWLGIALFCGLPNVYPWYALWLVPWSIAAGSGSAAIALWLATIFAVVRYLPDASGMFDGGLGRLVAAVAVAPLAIALADILPRTERKKVPARS